MLKGKTLELHCPIKPQFQSHPVEWKNPDGNIMFFNTFEGENDAVCNVFNEVLTIRFNLYLFVTTAVKDRRYSLVKLSQSEFVIKISDVTFSDGGKHTCTQYLQHPEEKTIKVTVLGGSERGEAKRSMSIVFILILCLILAKPKIETVTHEGKTVIRCTAEGNYPPPTISWQIRNGPEFQCKLSNSLDEKSNVRGAPVSNPIFIHEFIVVRHKYRTTHPHPTPPSIRNRLKQQKTC